MEEEEFCLNGAVLSDFPVSKYVAPINILELDLSIAIFFFQGGEGEHVETGGLNSPRRKHQLPSTTCYKI